ncbi:MAG: clan AA aspartic protease [bacterium]|nr:clan AA aspartic protease [bacterium]MDE0667629.1 clan AA aspartic protease [bacterium]MYB23781.1 clan AA aspartic protease [Acidimicrobiia bacterium]
MGETRVDVTIRNPAAPDRCWQGEFVVGTGATDSIVPRRHLEAIGLKPRGTRTFLLADGSEYRAEMTVAEVEFMGERTGCGVVLGPDDVEPLLGLTALESCGYAVDPVSCTLRRAVVRL